MSAFGNVSVANSASFTIRTSSSTVGISNTYNPVGYVQPGIAKWEDRSSGIAVGYPTLTLSVRPPTKGSRITKVSCKLAIPTLEAISGANVAGLTPAQQKAYELAAILEFLLPERCTAAERLILISQTVSLLSNVINASDDVPTDSSGTPLVPAIYSYERPY